MTTQRIATQIDIAAPIARVWQLLIDLDGYAGWNSYLVKVTGVADAGAIIRVHAAASPDGGIIEQDVAVLEAAFPVMRWEGGLPDKAQFRGDHRFELVAHGDGCRFLHSEDFTGTLAATIIAAHGARIAANFAIFNQCLKAAAESTRR
jgi:hypothetical protein